MKTNFFEHTIFFGFFKKKNKTFFLRKAFLEETFFFFESLILKRNIFWKRKKISFEKHFLRIVCTILIYDNIIDEKSIGAIVKFRKVNSKVGKVLKFKWHKSKELKNKSKELKFKWHKSKELKNKSKELKFKWHKSKELAEI